MLTRLAGWDQSYTTGLAYIRLRRSKTFRSIFGVKAHLNVSTSRRSMSSSKTMEMPAPSVGTKSNSMSTKVTTGAPGSATSPEARMRTKSGAAAVASDMQQKNASDGTGNGSSNLLFTSKISNDKAKFKFPLATRMNEEPNFVLTSEALIEAAGEGADTLLSDGKCVVEVDERGGGVCQQCY